VAKGRDSQGQPVRQKVIGGLTFGALTRKYAIGIAALLTFFFLSFASPAFLSVRNIHNILDQSAHIGIVACAHTIAIISGNFDLSSGAVFAMGGSVAALIAVSGYTKLGLVVGALVGLLIGLLNGLVISVLRLHSFIATLASSLIIGGTALVLTDGRLIIVRDPAFSVLGQSTIFSVRTPIFIFAAFALFTWVLLSRTRFGRHVYAVGGNAEAARLSGINVHLIQILVFGITGFAAALAGVITVSRMGQGQGDIGELVALQAIARVVIGGTSILGGQGAIGGTILGVLLLRLVGNGFNLLNVPPFYQRMFEGAIIFFAVAIETLSRRRRR
jgi:ribose transport system permease protein